MRSRLFFVPLVAAAAAILTTSPASSEPPPATAVKASAAPGLRADGPIVIHVTVPLCSNAQIDCGSGVAGDPGRLETNLYWGAVFGHRRFFDRPKSGFSRVELSRGEGEILQRAVYRRYIPAAPFGGRADDAAELLLVLDAYHGESIDKAVTDFYGRASRGGTVRFHDGEREREERISIAGYAGHNRLMDGLKLPPVPGAAAKGRAVPSFVLACYSEAYFGAALRAAGSKTLLMTSALMAPEGYLLEAMVSAISENGSTDRIRDLAVAAYMKWQKLSKKAAGTIFARSSV